MRTSNTSGTPITNGSQEDFEGSHPTANQSARSSKGKGARLAIQKNHSGVRGISIFPAGISRPGWNNEQDVKRATLGWHCACNITASIMKGNMTIRVLVTSDRSDEYTGKKGLVKQQIITVMDMSETGERLAQPIEYALSDEEKPVHAGKLQDKMINLGIRELLPFGGRLRARGKVVGLVGK
jgi:hypothetical protein